MHIKNELYQIKLLNNLLNIISRKRKRQLIIISFLIIFNGIAEIFTLSSIEPLLKIISNKNNLIDGFITNDLYYSITNFFNIDKTVFILVIFISILSITTILRLFTIFLINYVSALIGNEIGTLAYSNCLSQNYAYHLNTNSSKIISTIVTKTNSSVDTIKSFLNIFTSFIILISILITLLKINAQITIFTISAVTIFYFLIFKIIKDRLFRISKFRSELIQNQTQILQEGLGFVKDIILDKCQSLFIDQFKFKDKSLRIIDAKSDFFASAPKYLIELITIFFLLIFSSIYSFNSDNNLQLIPLIGSIAFGMQRLLPTTQQIYASYVIISTNYISVIDTLNLIKRPSITLQKTRRKVIFKNNLELKNISFRYNNKSNYIIKNFNLKIKKGERIGIIGESGRGKSTLIDILMGLIKPTLGEIFIDGESLHNSKRRFYLEKWYSAISHVPQSIYLSDGTIATNIAFGSKESEIDIDKLNISLKEAQLNNFIKENPLGINAKVGENGVQLSGGQRQRIGIARAIYKGGEVIFLDEATSSLDEETEKAIIECISELDRKYTIIIISHKKDILDFCDRIINL